MKDKIQFETFREIGAYEISNLTRTEPSAINYLSYKKFKVTIEPIKETTEVYIERLENMLLKENSHNLRRRIIEELTILKKYLQ